MTYVIVCYMYLSMHVNFVTASQLFYMMFCLLTIVSFNQSTYSIDEDDGPLRPVLVVSDTFVTDITVRVLSKSSGSATGKYNSENMCKS